MRTGNSDEDAIDGPESEKGLRRLWEKCVQAGNFSAFAAEISTHFLGSQRMRAAPGVRSGLANAQQLLETRPNRRHGNAVLKLPFSLFLALRYLKPKRTFLSILTLISVLGVMLGVTVLILVISVMTGFDRELRQKVIDFDANILVTGEEVLTNWRDLTEKIRATPHVVATAPYVQGPVIVEHNEQRLAPLIRGIDPEQEEKVVSLQKFMKAGKLDLSGDTTVLGIELARQLNVNVGDTVTVYSPGNLSIVLDRIKKLEHATAEEEKKAIAELREVVLPKDLTVTGIFETGHYVHDSQYLLVPLFIGQELYGLGDALHGITVKTQDPYD